MKKITRAWIVSAIVLLCWPICGFCQAINPISFTDTTATFGQTAVKQIRKLKERKLFLEGKVFQLERLSTAQQLRLMEYSEAVKLANQQKEAFTRIKLVQNERLELTNQISTEWEQHYKRSRKANKKWKILTGITGAVAVGLWLSP